MSVAAGGRPRLLLVGGAGGFVGRSVRRAFAPGWTIRSVHRHRDDPELRAGVEWVPTDAASVEEWDPLLREVDAVLTLAWYRWESPARFRRLADGLERLIDASRRRSVRRFVHVSVPPAPEDLERRLPYLFEKRRVDRRLSASGLSYRIVRPTLLYGPGDKLLGVMLRLMERYHRFPLFGDGRYHVSPLSVEDLGRALLGAAEGHSVGTVDAGGPVRYEYRDLTDRMFQALGRTPRYFRMRPRSAEALAGLLVALRSTLLYPYEVRWLVSDMLGLPPYAELGQPLARVEPYLAGAAAAIRRHGRAVSSAPG